MLGNAVKSAKYKLSQHKLLGENSQLSIFQVARLMDTVKNGEQEEGHNSNFIYFSLN